MPGPDGLVHLWDLFCLHVGTYSCRVRVTEAGASPNGYILGRTSDVPPGRILQIVLDLAPEAPGVVSLAHGSGRGWRIHVSQGMGETFEQRLRNMLVNS